MIWLYPSGAPPGGTFFFSGIGFFSRELAVPNKESGSHPAVFEECQSKELVMAYELKLLDGR